MAKVSRLYLLDDREKAIKVRQLQARDNKVECWLPKSQIDYMRKYGLTAEEQANGKLREIVVEIPDWLAAEKQLDFD